MTKFAISTEGAASMRKLSSDMRSLSEDIASRSGTLSSTVSGLGERLGVFEEKIMEVVAQVDSAQKVGEGAIETLSASIDGMAGKIESLVGFNV